MRRKLTRLFLWVCVHQVLLTAKAVLPQEASFNNQNITDETLRGITFMVPLSDLRHLDLSENFISTQGLSPLLQALPQTQIQTLKLRKNALSDSSILELCQVLPQTTLMHLDLRQNHLTDVAKEAIAQVLPTSPLRELKTNTFIDRFTQPLAIEAVELVKVPLSFSDVQILTSLLDHTKVKTLKMVHNYLGDEGAAHIISHLVAWPHLRHLSLEQNKINRIEKLGHVLPQLQLKTLSLSKNSRGHLRFEIFSEALAGSGLESLNLAENHIIDESIRPLLLALPTTQLHNLVLSYNELSEASAELLGLNLPHTQIQNLYLGHNNIGNTTAQNRGLDHLLMKTKSQQMAFWHHHTYGCKTFIEALSQTQLRRLEVENNYLISYVLERLFEVLPQTHITDLVLGENGDRKNSLSSFDSSYIIQKLAQANHLNSLALNSIQPPNNTEVFLIALAEVLPGLNLKNLYLGSWKMSGATSYTLIQSILLTNLETLNLSSCGIKEENASILFQGLDGKPLKTLIIDNNDLKDQTIQVLSQTLPQTNLKTLSLSFNKITDEGVTHLFGCLPHTQITYLALDGNKIKGESLAFLAQHLNQTGLKELYLLNNPIREAVRIQMLAPGLVNNTTLEVLEIGHNLKDTDLALAAFSNVLRQSNLKKLVLSISSSYSDHSIQALFHGLIEAPLEELVFYENTYSNKLTPAIFQIMRDVLPFTSLKILQMNIEFSLKHLEPQILEAVAVTGLTNIVLSSRLVSMNAHILSLLHEQNKTILPSWEY